MASSAAHPQTGFFGTIAFAGRSNVGKSSILNSLFHDNKLARVSKTPGRTQQLNFFQTSPPHVLHVIDMPGYGFAASVSKSVAAEWQSLVGEMIRFQADHLKCVYVLIDSRRGLFDVDMDFMHYLNESNVPFQLVLTKADQISSRDYHFLVNQFQLFMHGDIDLSQMRQNHKRIEKGGDEAVKVCDELNRLNVHRLSADMQHQIQNAIATEKLKRLRQAAAAKPVASNPSASSTTAPTIALPQNSILLSSNDKMRFETCRPYIFVTSTATGFGMPELRASIATETGIRVDTR
jgi:GTP-binding protein